ncbi:MAG: transglutaminase-like domain-containing protein, partial [Gemmatimonadota bacterium]|nr:transglutaminase-like domain-containing protein [Gemmatimonadota bacterium]
MYLLRPLPVILLALFCLVEGLLPSWAGARPAGKFESYDYSMIDRHALDCPKEMESNIKTLVEYLTAPASNEHEKLRAIFRWITANIEYDTEGFFADMTVEHAAEKTVQTEAEQIETPQAETAKTEDAESQGVITPELVLQKRTGDCNAYAVLTEAMLNEALLGLGPSGGQTDSAAGPAGSGLEDLAGVKILQVEGFAKGYGYRVGSNFEGIN